jgi:hypothetical protein
LRKSGPIAAKAAGITEAYKVDNSMGAPVTLDSGLFPQRKPLDWQELKNATNR